MKITVKNVDGRLGTGVASLSYTTQRDGGVTETVNTSAQKPARGSAPVGAAALGGPSPATQAAAKERAGTAKKASKKQPVGADLRVRPSLAPAAPLGILQSPAGIYC